MNDQSPREREQLLERALGDELVQRLDDLRTLIRAELPAERADVLMRAIEEVLVAVLSRVTSMASSTVLAALAGLAAKPGDTRHDAGHDR